MVFRIPKDKTEKYMPGLELEHEVGLSGVGVQVVTATLAVNTIATAANLIAAPSNNSYSDPCGPVMHSLGAPPTMVLPMQIGPQASSGAQTVNYQYCTADNSAVYVFARTWTMETGCVAGVGTRLVIIR